MSLVIDLQLFPGICYIKKLIEHKHIHFELYENFQKMSFRNRYIIMGANGPITLTVPVAGGREQKTLFTEIRVDYTQNWPRSHWRGITSAYRNSPYFDYYEQDLRDLLFSDTLHLFDLNKKILAWIFKCLKINIGVGFTEEFLPEYLNDFDYRNRFLPRNYLSQGDCTIRYPQLFEQRHGFHPNLSILDLLFCEGANARYLLQSGQ